MINTIEIPVSLRTLCSDYYDSSGSMMYAVASTGGLTLGSRRPLGCDTLGEWYYTLWHDFAYELERTAELDPDDLELTYWANWARENANKIAEYYEFE